MKITRVSKLTDQEHTREIQITEEQLARWKAGAFIQDLAPNLSADDREFIISGTTPEEWQDWIGDEA